MSQYLTILYEYQHTWPKAQTLSWRMAQCNKPVTHCYVIIKCMYCTTWSYIRQVDTVGIEIDLTVPLAFSLHLSSYSCVCSVHHTWTHIQTNIQTCTVIIPFFKSTASDTNPMYLESCTRVSCTPWYTLASYSCTPWYTLASYSCTPWYTLASYSCTPWYTHPS